MPPDFLFPEDAAPPSDLLSGGQKRGESMRRLRGGGE